MPACASTKPDHIIELQDDSRVFFEDVVEGLGSRPKSLAPKYFYDAEGSKLFDQICRLDEYYLYRTELELLPRVTHDLADDPSLNASAEINLVEFGAGSLHKVVPLLQTLSSVRRYTAIDISGHHLQAAAATLAPQFPDLDIQVIEADFTQPLRLSEEKSVSLGFFPGSTIGNFAPSEAVQFLETARQTLGPGSFMLLGVDTKKDVAILNQAYNDLTGVTARFNKNILVRINRELGGEFDLDQFEHQAWYNPEQGRMEMHLRSTRKQTVAVRDVRFEFDPDETIHTENSYKYGPEEFVGLAERAGWTLRRSWLADRNLFSMVLLACDP